MNDNRQRIMLSSNTELLETSPGKFKPYRVWPDGQRSPIRGLNKNNRRVWRTYKSEAEARENLGL